MGLCHSYLLIDTGFILGSIAALILKKYTLAGSLFAGYFLYPWIFEPMLMIIFRLAFCCTKGRYKDDFEDLNKRGCNVVYHPKYNMKLCGLEKNHPFDSCKYERVMQFLNSNHKIQLTPTRVEEVNLDKSEDSLLKQRRNPYNFSTTNH